MHVYVEQGKTLQIYTINIINLVKRMRTELNIMNRNITELTLREVHISLGVIIKLHSFQCVLNSDDRLSLYV